MVVVVLEGATVAAAFLSTGAGTLPADLGMVVLSAQPLSSSPARWPMS